MLRAIFVALVILVLAVPQVMAETKLDAKTMKAALKTTDIEESGFIDSVVQAALKGTIPPSIVDSSFQWARKKPKHQFQYFKQAVIHQAAQQGIDIK